MCENREENRYERMLFNYETTGGTDFRAAKLKAPVFTTFKEKPKCCRIRPPPLKDVHTMNEWKVPNVPLELLPKVQKIVNSDPRNVQQPYGKYEDLDRERVVHTRPRRIMTPALSLDDIPDPRTRQLLVCDVYTSTAVAAMRESAAGAYGKQVRAPLPDLPAPANPLALPKLCPPQVPREWRMQSARWERGALRAHCHASREFWTRDRN